jgi:molybdenum cofactor guanylyltransferase
MQVATPRQLGAIVLCGGESRRMGESKAWLRFGSETSLQRVVRRLSVITCPIVVVRARGQTIPVLSDDVLVTEDMLAHRGPLQGLASGLLALRGKVDAAFVSSTDAPFVDPALVMLLEKHRQFSDDLVVPEARGHRHPLAAIYNERVLPEIERMLARDELRLMDLLGRVRTRIVPEDELLRIDPRLRCLTNVNTPEAYREALDEDLSS